MKTLLPVSVVVLMEVFSTLADLSKSLKYYETLKDVQIHSRSKRSAHTEPIVDVRFKTLGKDFRLILQKRKHLFTNDFRAVVQGKDGKVSHFEVDEKRVLTGHLYGEAYSDVSAYISDTQVISAHIETEDEIYFIEPSEGHLEDSENYTMISYRGSDMLYSYKKSHQQDGKFCQFLRPEGGVVIEDDMTPVSHVDVDEAGPAYHFSMSNHTGSRQKRQSYTPLKETCPLMVVADYKFHLNIGRGKLERTASYMIGVIDRVDKLYRSTVWDTSDNFQGIGFEIKEIKIHEGYTPVQGKELHYNMDKTDWETKELLEVFSRSPSYRSYCLVHLFTHQKFNGGVLGLAYIASPRASSVGGICSPLYLKDGYRMSLNTGWSSSLNTAGKRILSQEAQLVAAHGHNFGSEHDTDNKQCAPEARLGGKYLMYPFAVSGYEANNNKFSICSRGNINNVLRFKADDCFKVKSNAFCGNGIVEPGEDCDAGFKGRAGNDPCCGKDCRLIEPAVCSDYNQPCCKECQAAGPDVVCEQSSVDSTSCLGEARCAGGFTCPDPSPKPDNIECVEKGRCQNGKCIPFCESRNKISCQCDTVAESCTVCCKAAFDAACLVEMVDEGGSQHPWYLTDGRPCVQGFCEKGECKKTKADLIVRIWDIIDNITIDTFVEFMRSNIVGTVLVLSLLIWIPGSCIITCVDRRREKKEKERREWLKATNRLLLRGEDKNGTVERIKTVNHVKLNRPMGSIVRDSKPQVTTTHTSVL